jgi:hypothetical protein
MLRKLRQLFKHIHIVDRALLLITLALLVWSLNEPEGSKFNQDNLGYDAFAMGIDEPKAYDFIEMVSGSPSIDLAPTAEGTLRGQLRATFIEVKQGHPEAYFVFRLPRSTVIDWDFEQVIGISGPEEMMADQQASKPWTCGDPRIPQYIGDEIGGQRLPDVWRFNCREDSLLVGLRIPDSVRRSEALKNRQGSVVAVLGSANLNFHIPSYRAIARRSRAEAEFALYYDAAALSGVAPIGRPSSPATLRLTPPDKSTKYETVSALSSIQPLPADEFGEGLSQVVIVEPTKDWHEVILGGVTNSDQARRASIADDLLFVLIGYLIGRVPGYWTSKDNKQKGAEEQKGAQEQKSAQEQKGTVRSHPPQPDPEQ